MSVQRDLLIGALGTSALIVGTERFVFKDSSSAHQRALVYLGALALIEFSAIAARIPRLPDPQQPMALSLWSHLGVTARMAGGGFYSVTGSLFDELGVWMGNKVLGKG